MSDIAIRVENLSKLYHIGRAQSRNDTLRDTLVDSLRAPLGWFHRNGHSGNGASDDTIWALRDVSFEVKRGEVVGIIGRNGAGKSTLLKILSRVTEPTKGRAIIDGRVGSLLEVGTGFHPELTGRENIYLNGAILGMKRTEIDRKFDEIVAFAEIEKFMDTPVKRYSSGMYVRLAFAVAAHMEPEILLVDEVLAVGDVVFQKKCLGKMGDVAKEGRTVLFVSHNMQAISTLTQRSLLLSSGKCLSEGETSSIIAEYLRIGTTSSAVYTDLASEIIPKVTRVELRTSDPNNIQRNGQPLEIHVEISTPVPIDGPAVAVQIVNSFQQPLVHLWSYESKLSIGNEPGVYCLVCRIPNLRLYAGHYTLKVHFAIGFGRQKLQTIEGICPHEIVLYGRERKHYDWQPSECVYLEDSLWRATKLL